MAGQDNNSQGFRSNFNNIQAALTATYAIVANQEDEIAALGTRLGAITNQNIRAEIVTGTNVVQALDQLIIGTTNVLTTGDNFNTVVTMAGAGAGGIKAVGNVALLHNTVNHTVVSPGANTPNNGYITAIYLDSVVGILTSATVRINVNTYTATSINSVSKTVTFAGNGVLETDANVSAGLGATLTFSNPFPVGQYDLQKEISNVAANAASGFAGLGTIATQNANNVNITGGYISSASTIVNGGWSIVPNGTHLYFTYNGTNVARLDSTGAFYSLGDLTAGQTGL